MSHNILVTGAGGFIARELIVELKRTHRIVAVHRNSIESQEKNVFNCSVGDISGDTDWSNVLPDVDTIYHLAAVAHNKASKSCDLEELFDQVNVKATVNLFKQAEKAGVKQFIFISSIGVIGNRTDDGPFDESSECKPSGYYAESKYKAEQELIKLSNCYNIELVIVRPPLVLSPSAPGNVAKLCKLLSKTSIIPLGGIDNKKSFISISNLVDFLILVGTHPLAKENIFVVSDDRVMSTSDLIVYLSEFMNKKIILLSGFSTIFKLLFKMFGMKALYNQLYCDLVIDSSKAKTLLGWRPKI